MKHDYNSNTNSCVKLNLYALGKLALSSNVLTYSMEQSPS
jgi:hypothetical protein